MKIRRINKVLPVIFLLGLIPCLTACSLGQPSKGEIIIPTLTLSPSYSRARFEYPADSQYILPFRQNVFLKAATAFN